MHSEVRRHCMDYMVCTGLLTFLFKFKKSAGLLVQYWLSNPKQSCSFSLHLYLDLPWPSTYIPLHSKLIQMAVVVHVNCGCYSLDIIKLLIHCITLLQETLCQYTSEGKKTLSVGLQDNTGLFPVLVFWLLIILSLFKIQLKNADYFSQYVTEDFNGYIKRKREIHCHGNHIEMQAMCEMYNRTIEVYQYSTGKNNSKLTVFMGSCVYWKQCKNLSHNLWHAGWKYFSLLVVWNSH